MTEYVFVKPVDGGRVRMPDRASTIMPASGAFVPRIQFYEALLLTGDIVKSDPPEEEKSPERLVLPPPPAEEQAHSERTAPTHTKRR